MELDDRPYRLVFEFNAGSRDARMKAGDFNFSLLPEAKQQDQFMTLRGLATNTAGLTPPELVSMLWQLPEDRLNLTVTKAAQVTIVGMDRVGLHIAVDPNNYVQVNNVPFLIIAIRSGYFVFNQQEDAIRHWRSWGVIDPIAQDFFLKKLEKALRALGNPPIAQTRPLTIERNLVHTQLGTRGPRSSVSTPSDQFLWNADGLALTPSRFSSEPGRNLLGDSIATLTQRQLEALEAALTRRLVLLWGPPGTGKSKTARSILTGLIAWTATSEQVVRILITGPTWTAIDNVADKMTALLHYNSLSHLASVRRLYSPISTTAVPVGYGMGSCPTDLSEPLYIELIDGLLTSQQSWIVAATADQVAKLVEGANIMQGMPEDAPRQAALFDYILIDEASQMDVAHAVVAYSSLVAQASVTVIGDDLQMPPIVLAPPPLGNELVVGSIYDFYRAYRNHQILPVMLDVNYRSNSEIIDFVRSAGYGPQFRPAYPNQRIQLADGVFLPTDLNAPMGWPADLVWTPEWSAILDPTQPVVGLVHNDEAASQRNEAEAKAVACLIATLWGRISGVADGAQELLGNGQPLNGKSFFEKGVGVVTPHRAQQSAVITWLEHVFQGCRNESWFRSIYDAVDTVERFQGQERMVMIASFGLGDKDQIRSEEEFLYSLNRFNVIASRAQAKLIVMVSRSLLDHLPSDPKVMRQCGLIKHFGDGYLRQERVVDLPDFPEGTLLKTP